MNYVDLLILASVALCFALGILTGFVIQVTGIIAVIGGIIASTLFGGMVAEALGRWIQNPQFASLAAYLMLFSTASVAIRLVAVMFSKMLEKMKLERLDKLLGGVVGGVKGLVICAVVIVIMNQYGTGSREAVQQSFLGGIVGRTADWIAGKAEESDLRNELERVGEKFKRGVESAGQKGKQLLEKKSEEKQDEEESTSP